MNMMSKERMRRHPAVPTRTLCKLAAVLLAVLSAALVPHAILLSEEFLGAPSLVGRVYHPQFRGGVVASTRDDRDRDNDDDVAAPRRRDDDCTLRFPSPYVTEDPPHPPRDPSWENLVTVVSPPEEGARAIDERPTWEVHTHGLWHRAAYVVVRVGNAMLMQRRSDAKWTYPRLWEYSAAETMEGDESFAEAADRAVGEEMGDLLREGVPSPRLTKCCGPITYVWEGEMPYMYLREKTVVEVYSAFVDGEHLGEEVLERISNGTPTGGENNGTEPVEVDGWMMMPIKTLRREARKLKAEKYAPWLLVALDQCHECWKYV